MFTNHGFNRGVAIASIIAVIACVGYSGQSRAEQVRIDTAQRVIGDERMAGSWQLAASPILEGKPAVYTVDGEELPAPSGQILIDSNGLTAVAHSPAPGMAAIYDFVRQGTPKKAGVAIKTRAVQLKALQAPSK
jgi:hypothetical protein